MELNQPQLAALVSYITTAVQSAGAQVPLVLEQLVARQLFVAVAFGVGGLLLGGVALLLYRKVYDDQWLCPVATVAAALAVGSLYAAVASFVNWLYPAAYLFDTLTGLVR